MPIRDSEAHIMKRTTLQTLLLTFPAFCLLGCIVYQSLTGLTPAFESAALADDDDDEGPTIDPMSVNANCYVCHIPFVREEISRTHFAEDVTCIECHGVSAAHVNDEDIGATKPDIVYERDEIDAKCVSCHEKHKASARDVIGRYIERSPVPDPVVCTDCHGHHRIERPESAKDCPYNPLFRGIGIYAELTTGGTG